MWGCREEPATDNTKEMRRTLREYHRQYDTVANFIANRTRAAHFYRLDSLGKYRSRGEQLELKYQAGMEFLRAGQTKKAIDLFREVRRLTQEAPPSRRGALDRHLREKLALCYLRLGEQENCLANHTSASCILPIRPAGYHTLPEGSRSAITLYTDLLEAFPERWDYRWLLNLAYMTLGEYPGGVPLAHRLPDSVFRSPHELPAFRDRGAELGVDDNALSGGAVVDDFDRDGDLDILTSSWGLDPGRDQLTFYRNEGDGAFSNQTVAAGLEGLTGGLNLKQTDYNNDGYPDVLVLRGAWLQEQGRQLNSLLRNNGDGTFSDVTLSAGLTGAHPTQTAVWRDFNNDGWVDLFIGNETFPGRGNRPHPCELYLNKGDGAFRESARGAGLALVSFVKGVTAGDYDNDGDADLYLSTYFDRNYLFRNEGVDDSGRPRFEDATQGARLAELMNTFPTWFWDYNNDGWLDLFVSEFDFMSQANQNVPPVYNVAAAAVGESVQRGKPRLYRNRGDGTFEEVAADAGLDQVLYTMGSNYGDLDNDGWLDMYLGTGDPDMSTLIPNKAFRNESGVFFQDVTYASGLGHLQKGHGIAFGDLDQDGDQDIYANLGGAYEGDLYRNALFENPYRGEHQWISIELEGKRSNRRGIGARVQLMLQEKGQKRTIHRELNSGGSFGANPLRLEIGLGSASLIDTIKVRWPGPGQTQQWTQVAPNQFIRLTEGVAEIEKLDYAPTPFKTQKGKHHH